MEVCTRKTASLTIHTVTKNSHLAIWKNGCFGQFRYSRIEVLQIAHVLQKLTI